ncbi:DUF302 domain-containing protein [Echinicola salinicaeni]|uniref:DUF302 domain-containing protein n=1 Tax=Echinicola salinicaeni TaxID=2762757 RepID=UPI0016495D6E|nr:DUF302 domain-containing protein [Echinicola salinicaeni]
MTYFFNKTLQNTSFDKVIDHVTDALKAEGFGVLTDIDVKATFKKKLDVDFRNYRILGACNPNFAHKAIGAEDKIGVFLPCNVVVQELENGNVEVAAVDPIASMSTVENPELGEIAGQVQESLKRVVAGL